MVSHLIPGAAVARYIASPSDTTSDTTVAAVKSLHETIRSVLGANYETFLQGSYRNDTGVADLNDVDIVAVRKSTVSTVFTPNTSVTNSVTWGQIFDEAQAKLESSPHYRGKTEIGDKCITVHTGFKADVVPAVRIGDDYQTDPIAIYSFREAVERQNYPRIHAAKNTDKHQRTDSAYKPAVRMFKRWARNWFSGTDTAPSFYVECLIHHVPDDQFHSADMAATFFLVGYWIQENVSTTSLVPSVAGDKDILVEAEWPSASFISFENQLSLSVGNVARALQAQTPEEATTYWRRAFNE
jgi:hypothetical protein